MKTETYLPYTSQRGHVEDVVLVGRHLPGIIRISRGYREDMVLWFEAQEGMKWSCGVVCET